MSTMRNMYADILSHPSITLPAAGRRVTMHAQSGLSRKTCHICKYIFQTDRPKYDPNYNKNNRRHRQRRWDRVAVSPQVHDSQRGRVQRAAAAAGQQRQRRRRQHPLPVPARQHRQHAATVPTGHRRQRTTAMPPYQRRQRSAAMPARQLRQREPPLSIRPQCPTATLAGVIDNSGGLPGRVFVHGTHGHCG